MSSTEFDKGVELFQIAAFGLGDTAEALDLISQGADMTLATRELKTTLMCAAAEGRTGIVKAMLNSGRDVALEARDDHGWTALITAAHRGNAETVKLLLDAGADPTAKDAMGRDALYYARGSKDAAKVMLISSALGLPATMADAKPASPRKRGFLAGF